MGIGLKLYPQTLGPVESPIWSTVHDQLTVDQDSEIWDVLNQKLRTNEVAAKVGHYFDDEGYRDVSDDDYGEPLTWARAGGIVRVLERHYGKGGMFYRTRATVAYLKCLDPNTRVILWWW